MRGYKLARFEADYPGCSNEPPWWPTKEKIRYFTTTDTDVRHGVGYLVDNPVNKKGELTALYGPNGGGHQQPALCATYGKRDPKTLVMPFAKWDAFAKMWEIITP